ncbi:GNAT family N-acetyltransferase [Actinokineospora sp.]|uniref:GNAT family N-acetyltransferase n=1 Tax=Actinokineospora sp. TaxID=1872133 RepID=UPI003D6BC4DA
MIMWSRLWETDVSHHTHERLAELFVLAYPRSAAKFSGARSWSSARPETRIVGTLDGHAVAHLGILRRFLRTDTGAGLLVGDVGLVAVHPDLHGRGVGGELLRRATAVLAGLDMPFGFLTCGNHVVPFYRSAGWHLLDGQVTRMIDSRNETVVYGEASMVLPVGAALSDWPAGQSVVRDGWEV